MEIHQIKTNMQTYHMTTQLPVSVYDLCGKLIHAVGVPSRPFDFIGTFPIRKLTDRDSKKHCNGFNEHFIIFQLTYPEAAHRYALVIGPFVYKRLSDSRISKITSAHGLNNRDKTLLKGYFKNLPTAKIASLKHHNTYLKMLFHSPERKTQPIPQYLLNKKIIQQNMIEYREIDFYHHDYLTEAKYFSHFFKKRLTPKDQRELENVEPGYVADDYVRNKKNIAIITIALIERYAVEHGLDAHISFTIGDAYLRAIEKAKKLSELDILPREALSRFSEALDKANKFSKKINDAKVFIDHHLAQDFKLKDIAQHVRIHPSYLSRLFKKETGMTVTQYILKEKVEEARMLLMYSNHTLREIADILNFCSKSHFIHSFKKVEGITPGEYIKAKTKPDMLRKV